MINDKSSSDLDSNVPGPSHSPFVAAPKQRKPPRKCFVKMKKKQNKKNKQHQKQRSRKVTFGKLWKQIFKSL